MDIIHEHLQHPAPKKSVSLWTLVLVVLITFFVAFLVFKNLWTIGNWLSGWAIEETRLFKIWQNVSLSGTVLQNGDYINYTHTLTLADGTVVGIKSKTIDLNSFSAPVTLQGIVQKYIQNVFVVEITSVDPLSLSGTVVPMTQEGIYVADAGVYLPQSFGTMYTLQNTSSSDKLSFLRVDTQQQLSLSYFVCTTSDESKDCAKMKKVFAGSAEKTFTTTNGDKFYKLDWVNSWFATNDIMWYFINDLAEQEVKNLANAFVIVNASYIADVLLPKVVSLCTDGVSSLQGISSHTIGRDINGLYVQLQWPVSWGVAMCKVVLDPSSSLGGQLLSFTPTRTSWSSSSDTPSLPSSSLDFSVKQFPLNVDKWLTYTSSTKWYSIFFPSSNISYASVPLNEDFDIDNLRCSAQINVIKFSDKALLSTNPTVKIFECTAKKDITLPSNAFVQTKLADGRIMLIEIMDGAWKDFASNIVFN